VNLRITFLLDGTGLVFDPAEPIHLDALLAWALAPKLRERMGLTANPDRDSPVQHIPLPLASSTIHGARVWHASALAPDGATAETLVYWRKRFRQGRAALAAGSPNLTNGVYRDWQMPVPLLLCHRLVGYASGQRKEVKRLLREVQSLGKKRAHGYGRVVGLEIEEIAEDYSLTCDGRAMRWLPTPGAARLVRPAPPYWHPQGRVPCCEVGDVWPPETAP